MSCFQMFFCLMAFIILVCNIGLHSGPSKVLLQTVNGDNNQSTALVLPSYSNTRKLLVHGSCTNRDISISQSRDSTSGIPQYIVQIVNTCVSGCFPSNVHLHCGWFASARIVNPRIFKRLSYDDCLVNAGKPLRSGQIIRFTYSNSFMYPLSFKYARFC
ncbi:PREDICTED: protein TAPETUM DETERMINANT 1-like [Nelumbo nucifera]|uniref:Protein TAPETUM DETERMINANT 1-like n=2 Tax=Nelumbo nucifera TaxID=4432 RepID=A0A1U8AC24_NELNU|nr:PREDICTED: protein TAPETUM DETERMINANT 1-like [Nelumbo nucifera]XP_010259265.1 PREDICTED: protein TAPETUM DETERMINANT 1-like [Nelumbo nucifera]DAD38283.1 TPA_asm: hypothetical protein HUJ06_008924 [Nelumbo nucifera]